MTDSGQRCRVVIIGAGMAGLSAARTLATDPKFAQEINITIIESSDQAGGRVHSEEFVDCTVDLGASYVEGSSEENPIVQLAKKWGLTLQPHTHGGNVAFDSGRQLDAGEAAEATNCLSTMLKSAFGEGDPPYSNISNSINVLSHLRGHLVNAPQMMELPDECSVDDMMARMPGTCKSNRLKHAARRYENYFGASLDKLSAKWFEYDEDFEAGPSPTVKESYGYMPLQLTHELQALGVALEFGACVTCVRRVSDTLMHVVALRCSSGAGCGTEEIIYDADYVIATPSLGVLKAGLIRFEPVLPLAHSMAISSLGFGGQERVILTFSSSFWPKDIKSFVAIPPDEVGEVIPVFIVCGPQTLGAFVSHSTGLKWLNKTDQEVVDIVLATLKSGLGVPHIPPVVDSRVTRWSSDKNFLGGWSYLAPGSEPGNFDTLAEPVYNGRLYFAGEATSRRHFSTVHGAYISGDRAAHQLLQHLASL